MDHILERVGIEPLYSHYYATHYPRIHAAAVRVWGSWKEAIEACGLDYNEVRKHREWSSEQVLEKVRQLERDHSPLSSKYVQIAHRPLYMASIRRFKSWGETMKAAGLDYSQIRLRRKMSPEEIKKQILELYNRGESLAYPYMRKNYQYLLAAGMKHLGNGSWGEARCLCGITDNYRKIGQQIKARQMREKKMELLGKVENN